MTSRQAFVNTFYLKLNLTSIIEKENYNRLGEHAAYR